MMASSNYDSLDDVPFSIRQQLASPTPSHFSNVSDSGHNLSQVMSPTGAYPQTHITSSAQQQQQHADAEAPAILFRSMAQLQIPSEILHSLQHLANVNLGGLQDLDTLRQGMGMLAQELNVRTESLSKAVTAVADLSSMVRDGAMVLEGQVKDASDERQCLVAQMNRVWKNQEDFSARLLALEGAASRLEESSMQQQAALRELDLKLGGLNLAFNQAREAVQQLQDEDPASLETAVGTMRSQTALLSTTMTRLEALSHDVDLANRRVAQQEAASKKDLEQLASVTDATVKLEARCEQIERALEERGQLMAPVPERTVRFQQTSKPPEVAKPTTSWQPLPGTEGTQVQRFEMSPQSLQQPAIDEWYTAEEEGEGPASWDFSWKPPGLFQPQSLGRDMLLKRCPLDSGRCLKIARS